MQRFAAGMSVQGELSCGPGAGKGPHQGKKKTHHLPPREGPGAAGGSWATEEDAAFIRRSPGAPRSCTQACTSPGRARMGWSKSALADHAAARKPHTASQEVLIAVAAEQKAALTFSGEPCSPAAAREILQGRQELQPRSAASQGRGWQGRCLGRLRRSGFN